MPREILDPVSIKSTTTSITTSKTRGVINKNKEKIKELFTSNIEETNLKTGEISTLTDKRIVKTKTTITGKIKRKEKIKSSYTVTDASGKVINKEIIRKRG